MGKYPTPLERAFELARTGQYANISEIKSELDKEGLSTDQLSGTMLIRQIRQIIATALK
jgi:ribosomal protein L29